MTSIEFFKSCWIHYLVLEDDFRKLERFVSFEEDNFKTYSVEFSKQYQAICSELDVVSKVYCKVINPNSNAKNIMQYAHEILGHVPDIKNAVVLCKEMNIEPYKEWSANLQNYQDGNDPLNVSPTWWKFYNRVKHCRLELDDNGKPYYMQANLENTLNALAGLFVMCMNCYKELCDQEGKEIKIPDEPSVLFKYKDWETGTIMMPGGVCISRI